MSRSDPAPRPDPPAPLVRVGDSVVLVLPASAAFGDFRADPAEHVRVVPTDVPGPQERVRLDVLRPGDLRMTARDSSGSEYHYTLIALC